jgi:polysaccharide pyruvyl transferase WcaK-like protein
VSGRPRRIFLVGLYGVDNLGDDAIRMAVERGASRLGAEVHRYAVRRPVSDPRGVHLRGAGWRGYIAAIRASDRIAIGGGGLLKDEGHALLRGYGVLLELLVTALLARAFGKRVVLLAIGAGPIHTHRGRLLVGAIARLSRLRQVRDEDSARTLRALGVGGVEVTVDPTFSLFEADTPGGERNGLAVLSVRPWFMFERDRVRRETALQAALAGAADALVEGGARPRFASLYWPRDRDASESVIARMTSGERAESLDGPLAWHELHAELRDARLTVAMRYHAIACAAMARCPVIPVAYEPKVVALARALGLEAVHVDDPDLHVRLPVLVRAALADPGAHRADRARLRELSEAAWRGLERALA